MEIWIIAVPMNKRKALVWPSCETNGARNNVTCNSSSKRILQSLRFVVKTGRRNSLSVPVTTTHLNQILAKYICTRCFLHMLTEAILISQWVILEMSHATKKQVRNTYTNSRGTLYPRTKAWLFTPNFWNCWVFTGMKWNIHKPHTEQ